MLLWNESGAVPKHLWQQRAVLERPASGSAPEKTNIYWLKNASSKLTQYGHHHVVPEDLYRPSGNEVEGCEDVPAVDQSVPWGSVGRFEAHGQSSQAAFVGASKSFAVLQQTAVEMEADVGLQTLRKTLQNLQGNGPHLLKPSK